MATNYGLSADWGADVAVPDYSKAMFGMASIFGEIGKNVAMVESGQAKMAMQMQEYQLGMREQMHKETMDLINANQIASDRRFAQSMEAIRSGLEFQKNQLQLQELENKVNDAAGVSDLGTRLPEYTALYSQAIGNRSPADMYYLQKRLSGEKYLLKSVEGANLYRDVNTAIEQLRHGDASYAELFKNLDSGDLDTLRSVAPTANTAEGLAVAIGQVKAKISGLSDEGAKSLLTHRFKFLDPEETAAMKEQMALIRKDYAPKIRLAAQAASEGDDTEYRRLQDEMNLEMQTTKNMYHYPDSFSRGRSTEAVDPSVAKKDVDNIAQEVRVRTNLATGLSAASDPVTRAMLSFMENNPIVSQSESITTSSGETKPFGEAPAQDRARYLASRLRAAGRTQDANAYQTFADKVLGAAPKIEDMYRLLGYYQADAEGRGAKFNPETAAIKVGESFARKLNEATQQLGTKDPNKLMELTNYASILLSGIGATVGYKRAGAQAAEITAANLGPEAKAAINSKVAKLVQEEGIRRGVREFRWSDEGVAFGKRLLDKELAAATAEAATQTAAKLGKYGLKGARARAILNPGTAIAAGLVAIPAGAQQLTEAEGVYDPTSNDMSRQFEPVKAAWNWLTGEGYLTTGDLQDMERQAIMADTRAIGDAFSTSVINLVKVARDPRADAAAIKLAMDTAVRNQGIFQEHLYANEATVDNLTSLENYLGPSEWRRLSNRYQTLTGQNVRNSLNQNPNTVMSTPTGTGMPNTGSAGGSAPNFSSTRPPPGR